MERAGCAEDGRVRDAAPTQDPGPAWIGEVVGGELRDAGVRGRRAGQRRRPYERLDGACGGGGTRVRVNSVGPRAEDGRVRDAASATTVHPCVGGKAERG